jgi:uncharacterized protein
MMWSDLLTAVALLIIIEGMVPFISPGRSKRVSKRLSELSERELRVAGLLGMLLGLALLYWVRS